MSDVQNASDMNTANTNRPTTRVVVPIRSEKRMEFPTLSQPEMDNIRFRERVSHTCTVGAVSAGTFALGVVVETLQDYDRWVAAGVPVVVAVALGVAAVLTSHGIKKLQGGS